MMYACLFCRRLQPLALFSLLLACTGCWEEIRYNPRQDDPSQDDSSQAHVIPQPEVHTIDMPVDAELIKSDPPTTERSEPEQPAVEAAVTQPDEPLAGVLASQADFTPSADPPAPPAELDWLDDTPAAEPADRPASIASPRDAAAAWRVGSKWSLAAAYFSKGLEAGRYNELLEQAEYAAKLLEINLPALPETTSSKKPDVASLQRLVVCYLLEESGPELLEQLGERFPTEHVALAELAIKTHSLLLVYTPDNKDLEPLISAISLSAKNSGLPETLWQKLVDLLRQRADFASIKRAVFELHDQATNSLAGSANE